MIKRKVLTVGEKAEIIRKLESGEKNSEVCKIYGLSSSTVSTLWKNKETILKAFRSNITESKRLKRCEKPDLDEALAKWCTAQINAGLPINGNILKAQAAKFAVEFGYENFTCTNGWIDRFKNRHNINYAKVTKEKKQLGPNLTDSMTEWVQKVWQNYRREQVSNEDYDQTSLFSSNLNDSYSTTEWLETMWLDYRSEYSEDDIYNAEEVGLFYDMAPDQITKFKDQKCVEGEMSNKRLTVLICTNMSGTDKRKLLVIGSSSKSCCFKDVKQLPVDYVPNPKTWMTHQVFVSYVHTWDAEMRKAQRRIILLIDNGPAHTNIPNLTNIKLVFLPPNSASALQPLYQGIIRNFKINYRKELLISLNAKLKKKTDLKGPGTLEAIRMMNDAWYDVTSDNIRNCFVKAMLQSALELDDEDSLPFSEWMKQHNIEAYKDVENIDDFAKVDDGVATSGVPTVEEIVAEMKTSSSEDDAENKDEDASEIPTLATAFECADQLQRFFETRSSTDGDVFQAITFLKHKLREDREKLITETMNKRDAGNLSSSEEPES